MVFFCWKWPLCIFFASQHFSNSCSVKSFFCEKGFFGIYFLLLKFFFCKTNFFTRQTSFFVSDKIVILKSMSHLQFITFSTKFLLLPPLTYPLHIFLVSGVFSNACQKKIVVAFFVIFNGWVGDQKNTFLKFFFSLKLFIFT